MKHKVKKSLSHKQTLISSLSGIYNNTYRLKPGQRNPYKTKSRNTRYIQNLQYYHLFSITHLHALFEREFKPQASTFPIGRRYYTSMEHNRMLDYGQSQSGSSLAAGTPLVHPVEPFKQSLKTCFIYTLTIVLKYYPAVIRSVFRKRYENGLPS